jgi:hypothetical protein
MKGEPAMLSGRQMAFVRRHAQALPFGRRSTFVRDVLARLRGKPTDGAVEAVSIIFERTSKLPAAAAAVFTRERVSP